MRKDDRWPASLLLARHGESQGNVALLAAEEAGSPWIDIAERDMDVALSERGERQAVALGRWLGQLGRRRPTVALTSPYRRAWETARLALAAGGLDGLELAQDERLREREFGAFDRLTRRGIEERYPEESKARTRIGKFYHRPPGGESWCDVGLRVRSLLDSVTREHGGERVVIVTHEVVILMFRYVLERLDEQRILALGRSEQLANCSVTCFEYDRRQGRSGGMRLGYSNEVVALEESGTPVTAESDAPVAPR